MSRDSLSELELDLELYVRIANRQREVAEFTDHSADVALLADVNARVDALTAAILVAREGAKRAPRLEDAQAIRVLPGLRNPESPVAGDGEPRHFCHTGKGTGPGPVIAACGRMVPLSHLAEGVTTATCERCAKTGEVIADTADLDAEEGALVFEVANVFAVRASVKDGISIADYLDRANDPRWVTKSGRSKAAAFKLARRVWPRLRAARKASEAADVIREAGGNLHYYCAMD